MQILSILTLAALAVASPIALQDYARSIKELADRQAGISVQDVNNFSFYAEHAGAAYCNSAVGPGTRISCGGNCPDVEANAVTVVGTYNGLFTGIAGYVAVDNARREIVFSVRGSNNIRNWISNVDFNFENTDLVAGGRVHDGFNRAWREMSSGVTTAIDKSLAANPGYRIVATGHSLGGAVATLGAASLRKGGRKVDIYTYGAPRVGNDVVSDYISNQPGPEFRITHRDDPVPRLPPIIFGYRHTSPEYWLSGRNSDAETYPVNEIKICTGNANIACNAGTFGLNVFAHLTYFGDVASCTRASSRLQSVSSVQAEDDAELEARLDAWVQQDIDFVGA